jgi:hypothetical protein
MIIPIVLYGHGEHLFSPVLDAVPLALPREPVLVLELQKRWNKIDGNATSLSWN